jgi:shikimate kinase
MLHHPAPAGRAAAPAAASKSASGPTPADPTAMAVKAAAAIAGKWAPQGLGCDSPIVIAIKGGAISMTVAGASPSTATIGPSPDHGVINATAEDGGKYVYKLDQDNTLSMVDPSRQTMKMTKCAA